jgi:hypothetical protein
LTRVRCTETKWHPTAEQALLGFLLLSQSADLIYNERSR